jgi:hypothetical protein
MENRGARTLLLTLLVGLLWEPYARAGGPSVVVDVQVRNQRFLDRLSHEGLNTKVDARKRLYESSLASLHQLFPTFAFRSRSTGEAGRTGTTVVLSIDDSGPAKWPAGDLVLSISITAGGGYSCPHGGKPVIAVSRAGLVPPDSSFIDMKWLKEAIQDLYRQPGCLRSLFQFVPIPANARYVPSSHAIKTDRKYPDLALYPAFPLSAGRFEVRSRRNRESRIFLACWPSRVSGPMVTAKASSCREPVEIERQPPLQKAWKEIFLLDTGEW